MYIAIIVRHDSPIICPDDQDQKHRSTARSLDDGSLDSSPVDARCHVLLKEMVAATYCDRSYMSFFLPICWVWLSTRERRYKRPDMRVCSAHEPRQVRIPNGLEVSCTVPMAMENMCARMHCQKGPVSLLHLALCVYSSV